MSTALSAVKGIGPSTVKDLEQYGITSAEDLANSSLGEICAIPGFAEARAVKVKEAALAVVGATPPPTPVEDCKAEPVAEASEADEQEPAEKKSKKKKDKKKKSKNKDKDDKEPKSDKKRKSKKDKKKNKKK
jgi:transcription termination factor NusA